MATSEEEKKEREGGSDYWVRTSNQARRRRRSRVAGRRAMERGGPGKSSTHKRARGVATQPTLAIGRSLADSTVIWRPAIRCASPLAPPVVGSSVTVTVSAHLAHESAGVSPSARFGAGARRRRQRSVTSAPSACARAPAGDPHRATHPAHGGGHWLDALGWAAPSRLVVSSLCAPPLKGPRRPKSRRKEEHQRQEWRKGKLEEQRGRKMRNII